MNRLAPQSTYRLQLHKGFTFDDAAAIAPYLSALGISHVYTSPYLQAAKNSMHGYDVVDHSRVNEELGGAAGHDRFCKTLGENRLGQVLDIVPNHMAITGKENAWWWDVLENGPASPFALYFDVEWQPPEEKLRNKVLVPILGDHYGRVLAAKQIKVVREEGSFEFRYFDHELPVAPRSMSDLLAEAARRTKSEYLGFLAGSLARLPLPTITDRERLLQRHRDKEVIHGLLTRLIHEREEVAGVIDECLNELNDDPDRLDSLLERQNYRVSFWKTAERELGHRRFFDVNTLVGLHMESQQVFDDTHRLLTEWIEQGVIDGLRVDHPDGLRDPEEYFNRLAAAAPRAWIVAEKILEEGEQLQPEWPIAGTTGYDFLNVLIGVFVDSSKEEQMTELYGEFTREPTDYLRLAHDKKILVLRDVLGSDVNRLTAEFMHICENDRNHRDYTRHDLHHAIRETIACFPVYRTYARVAENKITEKDREYISQAIAAAKANRPDLDAELFDFLASVLSLETRGQAMDEFVMRFQQFTGPAMAKGVEDTAFYCYNRLVSLNEVGGNPGKFGTSPDEFHKYCEAVQRTHPSTMLASSTHDTKRSEDVRARINVLSEMPEEWHETACRWAFAADRNRTDGLPDRNTEYLLYQTLLGAWPINEERMQQYMLKAVREAKQQTSWLSPNEKFEAALKRFIEALFAAEDLMADIAKFAGKLAGAGRGNSLAQTLVKLTAPGVPDTYQGCEVWDLSLVDPDNRRPVDYDSRKRLLDEVKNMPVEEVMRRDDEGTPKLWTMYTALQVRRERPGCFGGEGTYSPLYASGEKAQHLVAFQRGPDVITLVPRLIIGLNGEWGSTSLQLPEGAWVNRLTGEKFAGAAHSVSTLLKRFPVALLVREPA
jgi:(1->4)-alpha-D-glucan 1-alpha-D-glucosylmutase